MTTAIIAGSMLAIASAYIWYRINRHAFWQGLAKRALVYDAGLVAQEQAEREADLMNVRLEVAE